MSTLQAPTVTQIDRRPVLGYLTYLTAAVLFASNGTASKYLLINGVPWAQLAQLRVTVAFLLLLLVVAVTRPSTLRLKRSELPRLAVYGVFGVAGMQAMYFISIEHLPIGIALLFEFTAPIMVALWFRFVMHEHVRDRVFVALVLALAGLATVAHVWEGFSLDKVGVLAGLAAAVALALYYVEGERLVVARDPMSLAMWGFGAAAAFWAVAQPWWMFPWGSLSFSSTPFGATGPAIPGWAFAAWMILPGTVIPFALVLHSLRHIRATQASVVGMVEPIVASVIAYLLLGEVLTPVQMAGGVVILPDQKMADSIPSANVLGPEQAKVVSK